MINLTVLISTFLIGITGGTHCVFMCGPACGMIAQHDKKRIIFFHAGRLTAYFMLGLTVAFATSNFSFLQSQVAVLKPVWSLFHAAIFAWGLILVIFARQPIWFDRLTKKVWAKINKYAQHQRSAYLIGLIWAFLPCGLLYSALAIASLSGNPLEGGLRMVSFGLATTLYLVISPALWFKFKHSFGGQYQRWATRFAGLVICIFSILALESDLLHKIIEYCS